VTGKSLLKNDQDLEPAESKARKVDVLQIIILVRLQAGLSTFVWPMAQYCELDVIRGIVGVSIMTPSHLNIRCGMP
jgi:hypothetical protein